jgi:hypothetical protein
MDRMVEIIDGERLAARRVAIGEAGMPFRGNACVAMAQVNLAVGATCSTTTHYRVRVPKPGERAHSR